MRRSVYGLLLLGVLMLPPVARLLESIMVMHMHMQMPLLVFAGWLIAHRLQLRFPRWFSDWNRDGLPGILLFLLISLYWMIPRTMDEAVTSFGMEAFKFVSLPFLAGVPLRDSWPKLGSGGKLAVLAFFALSSLTMGVLYIYSPVPLCNNYLLIEQITLGWSYIIMAVCMAVYLGYTAFINPEDYEAKA